VPHHSIHFVLRPTQHPAGPRSLGTPRVVLGFLPKSTGSMSTPVSTIVYKIVYRLFVGFHAVNVVSRRSSDGPDDTERANGSARLRAARRRRRLHAVL